MAPNKGCKRRNRTLKRSLVTKDTTSPSPAAAQWGLDRLRNQNTEENREAPG